MRSPVKLVSGPGRIGNKSWRIAGPAGADLHREVRSGDLPDAVNQLADGQSATVMGMPPNNLLRSTRRTFWWRRKD